MASKKRTTAMQEAWIRAQREKRQKSEKAKADKDRKDSAELRRKYRNKKSK